jgi:phage-related protein
MEAGRPPSLKPVVWIGHSLEALRLFPEEVRHEAGYALELAQRGGKAKTAKPLRGLDAIEIVSDVEGDAFRVVYTVKLAGVVYVLHAFQKKSKRGIATPHKDIEMIRKRFKDAREDYKERTK